METNINNGYETESHVQMYTNTDASGRGPDRPASPCWRDVSSLLQSVLQDANRNKQPAKPQTDLSFKDFFRTSLEATLEVSSWSRAYLTPQPQQSFQQPTLKQGMNKDDSSSSSSCLNCARLERTVAELQKKLSQLQQQEDIKIQSQTEQVESNMVVEEDDNKWMEPLSPQSNCSDSSQNRTNTRSAAAHSSPKGTNTRSAAARSSPKGTNTGSAAARSSPKGTNTGSAAARSSQNRTNTGSASARSSPNRTNAGSAAARSSPNRTNAGSAAASKHSFSHPFKKSWLKRFRFLRYSPTQDQMWCHVCRRHAKHQNTPLIRGSRTFRLSTIKRHSSASYHIESMARRVSLASALKG